MCKEKKYEWCIEKLDFDELTKNICSEKHLNEFKAWCFDNNNFMFPGRLADTNSQTGIELLAELHKCYRKNWAEYALKEGFIQEVQEIFQIGDVIELTNVLGEVLKYIINCAGNNSIILNAADGQRWGNPSNVNNIFAITKKELSKNINNQKIPFRKVGHGAKDLI